MIELVLAYYLVLGVIKLCLWGKWGLKYILFDQVISTEEDEGKDRPFNTGWYQVLLPPPPPKSGL
jgi:hypothetical protein